MGKKRIIKKSQEELLKEQESIDAGMKKEMRSETALRVSEGRIYISSTYNNTIVTLTDSKGSVLTWSSAGSIGFKGAKKSTPFAASKVAEAICISARKMGVGRVAVFVRGIGSGRESAIRSLAGHGLDIVSVKDITPIPHNGCRPPKARRV